MDNQFNVWINQLRLLFDDLEEIFFFAKDTHGTFLYANPSHIRHLQKKSLSEVLHRNDYDFYPFSFAEHYSQDDRRVIQTGKPMINQVEIVRNFKGEMRWHSTTKIPFKNKQGTVLGLAGITRDLHRGAILMEKYSGLNQAIEYIEEDLSRDLKSEDLARVSGISVRQLERRFKAVFSKSPRKFILERRLIEARHRLLTTSNKIITIALECGFFDHSHFTRTYRAFFKISPQKQRAINKSKK
ncbi:MAG: helix-turn-helix domain-containing protein [Verrucomicrobiota bacterium]